MKKTSIFLLLLCFLAMVTSCSSDDIIKDNQLSNDKDNVFTVTASLGGEEGASEGQNHETRLTLTEGTNKVSVSWEVGDQINLVFVQGEIKKSDNVLVQEVLNNGKTAKFSFTVPEGIDANNAFDLYGVYGGNGLDSDVQYAKLSDKLGASTSLNDIQKGKDLMLYFQSTAVSLDNPSLDVKFKHVGSLFRIYLKNVGTTPLEGISEIRISGVNNEDKNWAINNVSGDVKFDLINGKIVLSESGTGNNVSFKSSETSIAAKSVATFWAWYPSNTTLQWPEVNMEIVDANGTVIQTSKNSRPSKAPASGKAFGIYGVWDGKDLNFSNNKFTVANLLFAKKLNADLGIPDGSTKGIALSGDYLAINSAGHETVYIDAKTGEKVGSFDLGALKGGNKNWYHTSDDDGNILISNRITEDGNTFRMYKMSSVEATPELLIEWTPDPVERLGRSKFSITGSVNSNAIITVPFNTTRNTRFARWQVVSGKLVSKVPDIVTVDMKVTGHRVNPYKSPTSPGRGWDNNVDIKYTSPTSLTSDYFITDYGDDLLSWVNGNTNVQTNFIHFNQADFVSNSLDLIEFNNATYVVTNLISGTDSNNADIVWIVDATNKTNFNRGTLWNSTSPAIVWQCPRGTYGAKSFGGPKNDNFGSDVLLKTSEDGKYLYMYFMFNNGYVVGYQFDYIDK